MDVDTTVTPSMVEEGENASVCVTILPPASLEREVSILITTAALSKYLVTSTPNVKWCRQGHRVRSMISKGEGFACYDLSITRYIGCVWILCSFWAESENQSELGTPQLQKLKNDDLENVDTLKC